METLNINKTIEELTEFILHLFLTSNLRDKLKAKHNIESDYYCSIDVANVTSEKSLYQLSFNIYYGAEFICSTVNEEKHGRKEGFVRNQILVEGSSFMNCLLRARDEIEDLYSDRLEEFRNNKLIKEIVE